MRWMGRGGGVAGVGGWWCGVVGVVRVKERDGVAGVGGWWCGVVVWGGGVVVAVAAKGMGLVVVVRVKERDGVAGSCVDGRGGGW